MTQKSDHKSFRLGVILSQKEVTIIPQGQITISYAQLIAGIFSLTVLLSTGVPILSNFIPFNLIESSPATVKDYDGK